MAEIFDASSGRARSNPVTHMVLLDFENEALEEITVHLPYSNLQELERQAAEQIGPSAARQPKNDDPLPLSGMYRVTSHSTGRTKDGVRLTIVLESDTGARFVNLDLSPQGASQLADDLYEKAAPG